MHSIQAYLERRTTEELQGMLRAYCDGCADFGIDIAFAICAIIADRDPKYVDPYAEFLRLCRMYLL